jgi:hypothetical protein
MLREIADEGGAIEVLEDHYSPYDREAELLGLITKDWHGGGFGFTETLSLTNNGRRHIGIDVVTPRSNNSFMSTVARVIAKFSRPRLSR